MSWIVVLDHTNGPPNEAGLARTHVERGRGNTYAIVARGKESELLEIARRLNALPARSDAQEELSATGEETR